MNVCVTAAIVGEFQRGKSTLANALLGRNAAKTGHGLSTTRKSRKFPLTPLVTLVDTPGFDANEKDTAQALEALETADVFLYVHESKALGATCAGLFRLALETGKPVVFLLNCRSFEKWAPEENGDIAETIEAELATRGFAENILSPDGRQVLPVNVLWAAFGLGLLNPGEPEDRTDIKRIRRYAADDLSIPGAADMPEEAFRAEMLRRSGVPELRKWLPGLPLAMIAKAVEAPAFEIGRIVDRFAEELGKRLETA